MKKYVTFLMAVLTFVTFGFASSASAEVAKKPFAMVSFTFDDAPRSVYTEAFPLLKKAGLHATVYLSTVTLDMPDYASWQDIKVLAASGWEIGAHAHSHQDLTKMSASDMVEEIAKSQRLFKERGFTPVSFSAPFGAYGERELLEIKKVYSSNRAAWGNGGINTNPEHDAYNLVSLGVTLNTTLDELQKQVKAIKKDGGWLILQFHHIDNGQAEPSPFPKDSIYSTKIFPQILEMILKEEVPVRTVRHIVENL
jgi:peptidoglycan/xylan/chitin deacetylase (PgdA/CDA1 family)